MTDSITVTPSAFHRIAALRESKGNPKLYLRIAVSGGGCSGFRYDMNFDEHIGADDVVFEDCAVVDSVSLPLMANATLDYVVGLTGENFKILNPQATAGCGCGESFSL